MAESFSSRPDAALHPELTADGLVLWRLRDPDHQRWCTVENFAGELALRVHDPTTGQTVVSETHETVVSVVQRAEKLRDQFMADGWALIDIDLDEPD